MARSIDCSTGNGNQLCLRRIDAHPFQQFGGGCHGAKKIFARIGNGAAIDCRPLRFRYSTSRCGGEGTQEPEPPIAPVQSFSRLFKVVQSLKSVPSKSVQTLQISLRRRLRNTAFRRISSTNPERGCAMRLCPDDDLTGPTSYGHRHPPGGGTAGADAAVFPAAPALAASAVLKTAATAGRHRTGTHAGGGLRARSPPPASGCCSA